MTSNERKIINFLLEAKGKTHIRLVAQKTNFSGDYARLLCRSLARAGYIGLENSNICRLLEKGRSCFENNDPVVDEPMAITANVTILSDESAVVSPASDRSDEEENQEEGAREANNNDKPASPVRGREGSQRTFASNGASGDEELDRALSDLEPSSQKDESEEKDKPEESRGETELTPEPKAEEEKEKETTPEVEIKTVMDTADGKEEAEAENPEKVALKEESVKPSGGFGASFKKFVNWFAEKK